MNLREFKVEMKEEMKEVGRGERAGVSGREKESKIGVGNVVMLLLMLLFKLLLLFLLRVTFEEELLSMNERNETASHISRANEEVEGRWTSCACWLFIGVS